MKREVLFRRVVSALCAVFVGSALTVLPGGVRAEAMSDGDFARLCSEGTADQVRQALKDGANPNARGTRDSKSAEPALHLAARSHTDAADKARALLAAGADVNARERLYGNTALMGAAVADKPEIAALLLSAGADVDARKANGETALFDAARNGNTRMIEALLRAGATVNARSKSGSTPLTDAACDGQPEAVRALLAAGADPKLRDGYGDALWYARHPNESADREGAAACVKLLEAAGDDAGRAAASEPGPWPGIEGEIIKTLPFRDRTGDNTLVLTARETGAGDARGREIFAYRFQKDAGGAARRIWRVYDFDRDCEYDVVAAFYGRRVGVTDLDKDGVSEIWLPYGLGCLSDAGPIRMKIIMYEGGKKYAMRGVNRNVGDGTPGDVGEMDAAFRSGPAAFREHARKLWKQIDEDYQPDLR